MKGKTPWAPLIALCGTSYVLIGSTSETILASCGPRERVEHVLDEKEYEQALVERFGVNLHFATEGREKGTVS